MFTDPATLRRFPRVHTLLRRALRLRCPRCGTGPLFRRWYTLNDCCTACRLDFEPIDGNTWFFMYVSSAAIIGVFFAGLYLWRPPTAWFGWLVLVPLCAAVMFATLPVRKALGVALDYLLEPRPLDAPGDNHRPPS